MRFSIIIPAYNVAAYLEKGVHSVLSQTFTDFELLLVNDGSTDASGEICDRLAAADTRIKTIHKANGGASDARNFGIREAKGDFLMFLDGDDYWNDSNALQLIADKLLVAGNPDLVLFYWQFINLNTGKRTVFNKKYAAAVSARSTKDEAVKSLLESGLFPSSAVITVTRREFIVKNGLYFTKGIKAEDVDWTLKVIDTAKTIEALNADFYTVLINRPGSVTTTADLRSLESVLYILDIWCPVFLQRNDAVSRLILGHLAFHYSTGFVILSVLNKEERRKMKPRLAEYGYLFAYMDSKRSRLVKYLVQAFGILPGTRIIGLLYTIRLNTR